MPWTFPTDYHSGLAGYAALASVPILYLFWALAYRRMKGHWASLSTLAIALVVAVLCFGMPAGMAVLAALDGAAFGLWPICWIIFPALVIFNLSVATGDFAVIKNSLAVVTDDRRLQALLVAFSFGAFIEGCAGFGTPVAITGAVLVGLGFPPLLAAGCCLLANTAPVAFGSIGIPIIVAGDVSGVDTFAISQLAGRTLPFITGVVPLYLVILLCGWRRGLEVWPAALVCGGTFALAQWYTSNYLGPMLPDIISSVLSIVSLTVFLRFWQPARIWTFDDEPAAPGRATLLYRPGQVLRAWAPFIILTVLVAGWGVGPLKQQLDSWSKLSFHLPGLDRMVVHDLKPIDAVFNLDLLSAAGTAVALAALFAAVVTRAPPALIVRVLAETLKGMRYPALSISAILGFAYLMKFGGMASALGLAFATTGAAFPFFSAMLGWLGVFMTGSDTSANALFGKLQQETALHIGIEPVITVSANSVGGVCGKMISPTSLSVAAAAVGLPGRESEIFRFTILHSLILAAVVGVLACLQAYVLPWLVPVAHHAEPATPSTAAAGLALSGGAYLALTVALALAVAVAARALGRGATPPPPA
jgi:lactate permease